VDALDAIMQELGAVARSAAPPLGIDLPVYAEAGRDPHAPIVLGSGSLAARVGVIGRDPGRTEVLRGEPFIGAGGRKLRDGLHRAALGGDAPDEAAAIRVGRAVFWANTVPFKPIGNKAWSVPVQRRFAPAMARLVLDLWTGSDLITCGNAAFDWIGLVEPQLAPALAAFWARGDRYEASLALEVRGRALRLHPLPHPSPLNATWYRRFPGLLDARLQALGWPDAADAALLGG
jgi:uracil-DNA glycosylase